MKLSTRVQRGLACISAMGILAIVPIALLAEPAAAAWPSTIKICNSNLGSLARNFDVFRVAPGAAYNNELAPGECTGNVSTPQHVRVDYRDDGANTDVLSAQIGVNGDGIDDSQGPYDPPCYTVTSGSTSVALNETTASNAGVNGIEIRLRNVATCGSTLADHIQVCSDAGSVGNFDLFKMDGSDSDTDLDYNNELSPGECSNWKDADGSNPLRIDLSDDGAHTVREWKYNNNGGAYAACERDSIISGELPEGGGGEDFTLTDITLSDGAVLHGKRIVRVYPNGSASNTMCGVSGAPAPAPADETVGFEGPEPTATTGNPDPEASAAAPGDQPNGNLYADEDGGQ